MQHFSRCLAVIGAVVMTGSAVYAGSNPFVVVIGNGPFAGTYNPPAAAVICFHSTKQHVYTAAWKDFSPPNAKSIAKVGIQVANPDASGPKVGDVRISFGDSDKAATVYQVFGQPLSLTVSGKRGDIAFQGKTQDGVRISVTVSCTDTTEM
jgi:hypothetical protein